MEPDSRQIGARRWEGAAAEVALLRRPVRAAGFGICVVLFWVGFVMAGRGRGERDGPPAALIFWANNRLTLTLADLMVSRRASGIIQKRRYGRRVLWVLAKEKEHVVCFGSRFPGVVRPAV